MIAYSRETTNLIATSLEDKLYVRSAVIAHGRSRHSGHFQSSFLHPGAGGGLRRVEYALKAIDCKMIQHTVSEGSLLAASVFVAGIQYYVAAIITRLLPPRVGNLLASRNAPPLTNRSTSWPRKSGSCKNRGPPEKEHMASADQTRGHLFLHRTIWLTSSCAGQGPAPLASRSRVVETLGSMVRSFHFVLPHSELGNQDLHCNGDEVSAEWTSSPLATSLGLFPVTEDRRFFNKGSEFHSSLYGYVPLKSLLQRLGQEEVDADAPLVCAAD